MNPEPAGNYAVAKPNPFVSQSASDPVPAYATLGVRVQNTSVMAIISLIAGMTAWFMFPGIGAIVAIITGHMAKREIRESGGRADGDSFATIGLWLGYAQVVLVLIVCVFLIIVIVAAIPMAH